jgi:hypothetical protein
MSSKFGRVASFDEIKMEKIALPMLFTYAYLERVHLLGNLGVPQSEMLMRQVQLNNEIESWLSPYIPENSAYWEQSEEHKKYLTFEMSKMPQYHTSFMRHLNAWNRLLMREEARNNLLLTKTAAARL